MANVEVKNKNGEVQIVPEHYLEAFPDEFKPVTKTTTPAKADTKKES